MTFSSKQSYYDLFDAVTISWKKSQVNNPKHDPEFVASKKRLKKIWVRWHEVPDFFMVRDCAIAQRTQFFSIILIR